MDITVPSIYLRNTAYIVRIFAGVSIPVGRKLNKKIYKENTAPKARDAFGAVFVRIVKIVLYARDKKERRWVLSIRL